VTLRGPVVGWAPVPGKGRARCIKESTAAVIAKTQYIFEILNLCEEVEDGSRQL
jgi:hypothetical protein